ncbi:putative helicase mov-10-B.1 [Sitodiplosis mosellana]|uniref:putative helicase mov-10-B.1 n=1 Tax=Sitodiplosis mosellana TaxID=263140 RepID=UPI00244406BD|nr:putative helicase mov-10-B.1 [Sitodiplosis mosellana]
MNTHKVEPPKRKIQIIDALPQRPFKIPKRTTRVDDEKHNTIPFGRLFKGQLEQYAIPPAIIDLELNDDDTSKFESIRENFGDARISSNVYIEKFSTLIHMEEAANSKHLATFDLQNVQISIHSRTSPIQLFKFSHGDYQKYYRAWRRGTIVAFTAKPTGSEVDTLQHNALKWIKEHNLFSILIGNPRYELTSPQKLDSEYSFQFCDELNEEQKNAVKYIVQADKDSNPFILFGPPGTGKTRTLVAAIAEIVAKRETAVLVCAQTNATCDEITERLLAVTHNISLFRMYARSYSKEKLSAKISTVCNFKAGEFQFPSLEYLYKYRIVVCTLLTAGFLVGARGDPNFNSSHFTHVFIDEAGCITEPVSMIPIAGLCTDYEKVNSVIVLAGDTKQLDAISLSKFAAKCGYQTSFMEYLQNSKPCYQLASQTNNMIQLTKNYRSHPEILKIPNIQFYDGLLEPKAGTGATHRFIGNDLLPNKEFPMIFDSVKGVCKQSPNSTTYYNEKEAEAVIEWVQKLLDKKCTGMEVTQRDIGIISPYHRQCEVIREDLINNGCPDITVGSAEVFQGQERPIMIISTVRTESDNLEFVTNPRVE